MYLSLNVNLYSNNIWYVNLNLKTQRMDWHTILKMAPNWFYLNYKIKIKSWTRVQAQTTNIWFIFAIQNQKLYFLSFVSNEGLVKECSFHIVILKYWVSYVIYCVGVFHFVKWYQGLMLRFIRKYRMKKLKRIHSLQLYQNCILVHWFLNVISVTGFWLI